MAASNSPSSRSQDGNGVGRRPILLSLLAVSLMAAVTLWQRRQQLQIQLASSVSLAASLSGSIGGQHSRSPLGRLGLADDRAGARNRCGGEGGAGNHAACSLQLAPSPFADGCQLLRDVCVDQGAAILYNEQDAQRLQRADGFEMLEPSNANHRRFSFIHHTGGGADDRFKSPAIRVRPAASMEGAAYLRGEPLFSSCTVPVVWYPFERLTNFAHLFRDNAAKILGGLEGSPGWRSAAKLVVMTAEGLAMPAWNLDVLQPLSQLRVETWADFTSRLPAAEVAGGRGFVPAGCSGCDEGLPPVSAEGGPQRCFRHMFVCTEGLNSSSWPLHGLGQHLVRHYGQQQRLDEPSSMAAAGDSGAGDVQQPAPDEQVQRDAAAGPQPSEEKAKVLRILFHKRGGLSRQLLNVEELLRQCNSWRHTSKKTGERLRASCAQVELPSLQAGMAAAQEADVFVGMHGANMANAWLMRPGSSMIELQAYGFDEGPAHLQYPIFNARDNATRVQWWLISACDPAASTPGEAELQGRGTPVGWAKDRNLRIGWPALAQVLKTAVDVSGDMDEYWRRWEEGRWWWWMDGSGGLTPAGPGRVTKMRCPKEGAGTDRSGGGAADRPKRKRPRQPSTPVQSS